MGCSLPTSQQRNKSYAVDYLILCVCGWGWVGWGEILAPQTCATRALLSRVLHIDALGEYLFAAPSA